ncbi:MAG: glycosyltransferase family 4 protein [Holosporales bacterium]|jgi:glycosyltransferase involved in cell wall biosynthesis|nr:glycosyltransferase family 4 protein [Holosporales bacterium]
MTLPDIFEGKNVLLLVTEEQYFLSHRLALAKALQQRGAIVSVATTPTIKTSLIHYGEDIRIIPFPWNRKSMNLLKEAKILFRLFYLLYKEKPKYILNVSLKPVLYGTIATLFSTKARCINFITGLGYLFTEKTLKILCIKKALLLVLRFLLKPTCIIVQNTDDYALFHALALSHLSIVRGSGVDCTRFSPTSEPSGSCTIVLPARMLWHKGIREFVEAARILKTEKIEAQFLLVGRADPQNPAAVPIEILQDWTKSGVVKWCEEQKDMVRVFAESHIVCLPSYREGIPKALLEAAASGRPIITTDSVGCREVVRHQDNGLLVPPQTVFPLADALRTLIQNPKLRLKMGKRGRERAEQEFNQEKICEETLKLIEDFSI